jgi:anthranilate/para-aminobenzoate synthase component I
LLASLLPAGSVTGTPKWAVSREICNIESTPRGYYTGVFAWAPAADELDSTVLIRGFFNNGKRWTAGLGAGITTLSDPLSEVRELDLKWQSFAARWKRMCDSSSGTDSGEFMQTEKSSRGGL